MVNPVEVVRQRLLRGIGGQLLGAFGLVVVLALLVALISLSATQEATARLEHLQESQRYMVSALKDLEVGAEVQNSSVQAYLLSGDDRYLRNQQEGQFRFADAFDTLAYLTVAEDGQALLDDIDEARERFENAALSQLALYRQGWQRSATYLWRGEGQDSKRQLEQRIASFRDWHHNAVQAEVATARERGRLALLISIGGVSLTALGSLVLGLRLTRSLTGRLGTLAVAAGAIGREDFSVRVAVSGTDEVAALSSAMNRMAEHLETSQRALRESRQREQQSLEQYRLLAENAMDVVYALDVDGCYRYVNAAIEHVAGYHPSEMLGRHFTEFLPEELRPVRLEAFARRMQGEATASSEEIEFVGRDGRRIPLELRLATIRRDGEIVGLQGIARDVTRRKAMEAQIRRLAELEHRRADQLQQVVRVGRDIARLSSLDELLSNAAALLHEVFGYERVAIFLLDPLDHQLSLKATAGSTPEPFPLLPSMPEKQGVLSWVVSHGEPLRVGDILTDERYLELPIARDARSEVAVPIRTGGQMLGVLDVESSEVDHFDANDEATLMILADQIATAIQNARLFEQQHSLAVAEERNRLAREIHDTLAQGLTAITLQLEVADALLESGPEVVRPKVLKALELTRSNLEEARRSVMDLRAAPLQEKTLPAALEELISSFARDHDIQAIFRSQEVRGRLPAATEAGVYRIAQEALNNIGKHADPSAVRLTLEMDGLDLVLTVEDDGAGFDTSAPAPSRRQGGFGLIGMQERAKLLGGQIEINSAPGRGTRVTARVPTPARREATEAVEAAVGRSQA